MANGEKNVCRYVDVISNFMMQFWNEREGTRQHVHRHFQTRETNENKTAETWRVTRARWGKTSGFKCWANTTS